MAVDGTIPKVTELEQGWLNRKDMAKSCGVTPMIFSSWEVKAVAVYRNASYFTVKDVLANRRQVAIDAGVEKAMAERAAKLRDAANGLNPLDPDDAKLMELHERTEKQAIANAIARREYAPITVLQDALGKMCSQISAVLESIPVKLKRRCPKLGATDIEVVKKEIIKCQNLASSLTIGVDEINAK